MFKKIYGALICAFVAFALAACGGDDGNADTSDPATPAPPGSVVHNPGQIPGLGEYPGQLQGEAFRLPDGVVLTGTLRGAGDQNVLGGSISRKDVPARESLKGIAIVAGSYDAQIGSGADVAIHIPLRNDNAVPVTVTFPARLIMKARSAEYQSGVLLKNASVTIPAGANYTVALVMYCTNLHRHGSSPSTEYDFGVISNSSLLVDLTARLTGKKINIEEYENLNMAEFERYWAIYLGLSNMVWNLTDHGMALSSADWQWIDALPNSQ